MKNPFSRAQTLLAGYVTAVLAAFINPIEVRQRSVLGGPDMLRTSSGASQFAGRIALASGTAYVTVSTQMVNSDSIILHAFSIATTAVSGMVGMTAVGSIQSGIAFTLGYADGIGRGPGGTFMWELRRTS